jgi:hypothetical protein
MNDKPKIQRNISGLMVAVIQALKTLAKP